MASNTIIQIKRSQTTATPPSLANGELAYSYSSNKLFIGQTNSNTASVTVEYIGGKLLVDKVANLESIVAGGNRTFATITLTDATENSVLFAKTGGIVDFITGDSGKILQIAANGTPTFDDLNGGTF
jgi:hypothetical protein